MSDRPDLIDPVPVDEPLPGELIPDTPDITKPGHPEEPDVINPRE